MKVRFQSLVLNLKEIITNSDLNLVSSFLKLTDEKNRIKSYVNSD